MTEFIPPGTRWFDLPSPFPMKRGGALHGARIAYETWGRLNPARDNAVLIVTGLSPDAHAASNDGNPEPGWWEAMLGSGKPIDTDRWFVLCVNSLGSCKGSTGPASSNPETGTLYRLDFPELSVEDGADASVAVVRGLGIERLACVIGNSMGGMTALALLQRHPGIARSHVNISGAARALPFSIAIRSLQREAIRLDPNWNHGDYSDDAYPESGMRMARKLGVITYRSALEWDGRFGRVRLDSDRRDDDAFGLEFEVESYLEGHARRFVRRFDRTATSTSAARWTGSTLAKAAAAMSRAGWPRSASTRRWRSACIPTSCFRCSSRSRSPMACARAAATRASCRCHRRRGTMPSWSISSASGRRCAGSWTASASPYIARRHKHITAGLLDSGHGRSLLPPHRRRAG